MAIKIKYDSVKVGDSLPTITVDNVSRPDFVRYAGASGDFVPLHYDQSFVEAAGIPTVFAQGMWTAGCLGRVLTDYAGAGNVRRYRVRFSRQVWPGDTLTCRGKVTNKVEQNGEKLIEGDVEVINQKGEATVKGNFIVLAS
ncbi:MAG TPA: MaoC/PaaZ C-terminal domain-containing protein [Candidatus Binataceae bacterium]|nr:MaoC/PaaZ C-terminal domain-containing protein [Candidatus Binataceae bacterium]